MQVQNRFYQLCSKRGPQAPMDLFGRKRQVKLKLTDELPFTSLESYSSRLTSKDELKNLFSSLLLGLMYVVLIRLVIYVNKLFVHSKFVYMLLLLLTFAIPPTRTPRVKLCEACQQVPSHLPSPHHSSGTELLTCIQLFRERLSDEVHERYCGWF